MVSTLVNNATMVTVLPRYWCSYDCCGTMVAMVNKVPVVTFATVFTKVARCTLMRQKFLALRTYPVPQFRTDSHLTFRNLASYI